MIGASGAAEFGGIVGGSSLRAAQGSGSGPDFLSVLREAERAERPAEARGDRQQSAEVSWKERVERQREVENDPEAFRRAQEGAEQLVATTFIVPILQQLRDSSMAEGPFGPGAYEKRLGPMLDAQIADRIVSAQRLLIVEAVRDRMLGAIQSRASGRTAEGAE